MLSIRSIDDYAKQTGLSILPMGQREFQLGEMVSMKPSGEIEPCRSTIIDLVEEFNFPEIKKEVSNLKPQLKKLTYRRCEHMPLLTYWPIFNSGENPGLPNFPKELSTSTSILVEYSEHRMVEYPSELIYLLSMILDIIQSVDIGLYKERFMGKAFATQLFTSSIKLVYPTNQRTVIWNWIKENEINVSGSVNQGVIELVQIDSLNIPWMGRFQVIGK